VPLVSHAGFPDYAGKPARLTSSGRKEGSRHVLLQQSAIHGGEGEGGEGGGGESGGKIVANQRKVEMG